MTSKVITERAKLLIRTSLGTYEKLHIVRALFLAGNELELSELAERSGLPIATVQETLGSLIADHVVVARAPNRFAYDACDPERGEDVAEVCELLAQGAVEITALLNTEALARAREALEARLRVVLGASPSSPPDGSSENG